MNMTPFTQAFVIKTTLQNMKNMVDLSMRKTVARLGDFTDDPEKRVEVLNTLASLDKIHKTIDAIYEHNVELFEEDNNKHA